MIDVVLMVGKILLLGLLYLFLFAMMRTGIGLVKGQRAQQEVWSISVEKGPKELRGVKVVVSGPVVIGRSPGADIVIDDTFVSGRHARFSPLGEGLLVEDLGSTNGTLLNGQPVTSPSGLRAGDQVAIGAVTLKVAHK